MTLTTPSTPRLSEVARHLVIPEGITTSVFPRVKRRLALMRVAFDPWQEGAATVALGCRPDGKFAATVGGIVWSIPRQVGKTYTVGNLLIALAIEIPGLRIVWTSHHGRTTTNTFRSMQGMVRRKEVVPFMPPGGGIRTANGEQEIAFANGSIVMFGSREQGFGRGMDAVDVLVFDEAQILDIKALEDMVPATNQARNPHGGLVFFIGTPPRPVDNGEAFTAKRERALSGKAADLFYVEMSADPQADLDDREQWAKANPSFPHRTPVESMLRMRENIPDDDSWRREALGVWQQVSARGVIPLDAWTDRLDEMSMAVDRMALGIEVGPDLESASVVLAGQRGDDDWHVEIDETRTGAAWLIAYVKSLLEANPQVMGVAGDVGGPLKALTEEKGGRWFLKGTRIEVHAPKVVELGAACSRLLDGVVTGWLRHTGQPQLTTAVQVAGKRPLGDTGMWVFSRKTAVADITSIQAATLALWWAQNGKAKRRTGRTGGRRAVVLA